jgi:hypothetical protein
MQPFLMSGCNQTSWILKGRESIKKHHFFLQNLSQKKTSLQEHIHGLLQMPF